MTIPYEVVDLRKKVETEGLCALTWATAKPAVGGATADVLKTLCVEETSQSYSSVPSSRRPLHSTFTLFLLLFEHDARPEHRVNYL